MIYHIYLKEWKLVKKLVGNLHDKTEYVIHIRNLRQPLNHWLVLEKIHRIIKFNQNAWPKPHIDINAGLIKKAKTDFEKKCFKFMNNIVSGKTVKNVRKHRDNKLSATESRRELVSEPNYHTTTFLKENLLAIELKKFWNTYE